MISWMERAEQDLEQQLAEGFITQRQFNEGMRDIQAEYEEQREEAAQSFREGWDG